MRSSALTHSALVIQAARSYAFVKIVHLRLWRREETRSLFYAQFSRISQESKHFRNLKALDLWLSQSALGQHLVSELDCYSEYETLVWLAVGSDAQQELTFHLENSQDLQW